jgi:uncharacterized membrane protein
MAFSVVVLGDQIFLDTILRPGYILSIFKRIQYDALIGQVGKLDESL